MIGSTLIFNSRGRFMRRAVVGGSIFAFLSIALFSGPLASHARAGFWTLTDENSVVDINTTSQEGMNFWSVDGVEHLFQQWFWYRVGNTPEASIDTLTLLVEGVTDTDFDLDDDTLFVRYADAVNNFELEVRFVLDGGLAGSGSSDIAEQISITNTGNSPLDMHFFQYVDFDLEGTPGGDEAVFTNANTVRQSEGLQRLTETVITPVPSHREIDNFAVTRTKLNDGVATTLSDTPATGVSFGPGDVTWAFEWDVVIQPNATFQISKDKNLNAIPEPGSCLLLVAGLASLLTRRRRFRR